MKKIAVGVSALVLVGAMVFLFVDRESPVTREPAAAQIQTAELSEPQATESQLTPSVGQAAPEVVEPLPQVAQPVRAEVARGMTERVEVPILFGAYLALISVNGWEIPRISAVFGVGEADALKLKSFASAAMEASAAYQSAQFASLCERINELNTAEAVGQALKEVDDSIMRHQASLAEGAAAELGRELTAKLMADAAKNETHASRADFVKVMKEKGLSPTAVMTKLCSGVHALGD